MASEALKRVVMLAARLDSRREARLYPDHSPHPNARTLTLPDGSTAPDVLRAWAGFDVRYPQPAASKRSSQEIANAEGVVTAKPIAEALAGLPQVKDAADAKDGYGVVLGDPGERVLWIPKEGEPVILSPEKDRESFDAWVASLFSE